jgi:hypothetical protein
MTIRTWARRLFARTSRTARKAPAGFRPRVEALESRLALSQVTLTPLPNQSTGEGKAVSLGVTATAGGDALTFSATGLPPGLSINSSTGTISGTVAAGAAQAAPSIDSHPFDHAPFRPGPIAQGLAGHYPVTVTASDGPVSANTTFDWGIYSITSVAGENYDVNGDATDGPELSHFPVLGNHTQSMAADQGTANGTGGTTFQGVMLSDSRIHANPPVVGFDLITGSAPDWFKFHVDPGLVGQLNEVTARITTWGGSHSSSYSLDIRTNGDMAHTHVSGDGTVSTLVSSFFTGDQGSDIFFGVSKDFGPNEAVGYAVTFTVHHGDPLPADPTFTTTVVTSSAHAWFYGQPETFTAQVSNASPGGGAVPTGSVQFQIDGSNVGQAVGLDASGRATFTTTTLGPGLHLVQAVYSSNQSTIQGSSGALSGAVTVTAAPLTITANDLPPIIQGEALPTTFSVSYSGFVNNETSSVLGGVLTFTLTPTTGGYIITPSGLTSGNYAIHFVSSTLTVLSYAQATANLEARVDAANLPHGIEQSLDSQLQAAIDSFAAGDTADGVSELRTFITHVSDQSGRHIDAAHADAWIKYAQRIIKAVG